MKRLTNLIGLLAMTVPTKTKAHTNSLGEPFVPAKTKEPIALKTTYPTGVNTWEHISPDTCTEWMGANNVGKLYSRFEVSPKGDSIVNKKKLILQPVEKGFA